MKHKTRKGFKSTRKRRGMKTRRVRIQHGGIRIKIINRTTGEFVGDYDYDEDGGGVDKDGKPQGHGKMTYKDGIVYEGDFKDGLANGHGKCEYANGDVYEGEFENDLMHGRGKMTFADGNVYEGNWLNSEMNGRGIMKFPNGATYDGLWSDGLKNGQGTMTYKDGEIYEGEWKDDARNGHGILKFPSGATYDGLWSDDARNGHGILKFPSGATYDGLWSDDVRNGQGTMTYKDGEIYEGEWKDDARNGHGIMKFPSGATYDGLWSDDARNGHGTFTFVSGDVYVGELKDGDFNGQGTMRYAEGDVYVGEWSADLRNGHGVMTYHNNGGVYEGPWHYGARHGADGKMTYADGRVYEGEWWKDNMHGDGKMTGADGSTIYEGLWRNNRQNPHFFDPATGKLADNDGYNPPAPIMRFLNSGNVLGASDRYFDVFFEEKNVLDELEEDPTTIALKLNRSYYVLSKDAIIMMMNDKRLIRYECRRTDHADNFSIDADVNKTVPYFGLNGLVSDQGGVVLLFDLWAAINSGHNAYEFVKTGRKLLTVASHHVAYDYGSWVSSAHCQHDKDADIYKLLKLRIAKRPRPIPTQKTRKKMRHSD